jgi:hypothetical protein
MTTVNSLKDWLCCNKRKPCDYSNFSVIDLKEAADYSTETKEYLKKIFYNQIIGLKLLSDLAEELGWENVKNTFISPSIPTEGRAIKKGDFGEILFTAILEEIHGYKTPFYKIYHKIIAEQSLPRTDILCLKLDDNNSINEVCFVESKLRIVHDDYAAKKGVKQIYDEYDTDLPDILRFTMKMLDYQQSELRNPFIKYLASRNHNQNLDNFRLSLCWESDQWNEVPLKILEAEELKLANLTVHVIRIDGLETIIKEVFSEFDVEGLLDDE